MQKFWLLDRLQKHLLIEAYFTLGIVRAAILTVPFKQLVKSLAQRQYIEAPSVEQQQLLLAMAIGKAVRGAAVYTPWESLCLAQALTAQRMLSRRDVGGVFYLGARLNSAEQEKLKAHAWLQCGQQVITGEAGYKGYAILSSYSWGRRGCGF